MTVLGGGLYRVQVEQSTDVWVDVGDLERSTYGVRGGTERRRVFRTTYVRSQRKEYTLTLAGLLNDADPGQAALLAAEEANTPIRVRWSDDGSSIEYSMMTVNVTSTTNEAPADDFETISFDLTSDAAPIDTAVPPATVEELISRFNAIGPATMSLDQMIEAGRNHSLTNGASVDPIPPVGGTGSSALALHAATGAGLKYDAVAVALHPGGAIAGAGAQAGAPGTVSSQTNLVSEIGTPHLSDVSLIFLYQANDNANGYEWGLRSTDGSQSMNRSIPPGGQNARWSQLSENGPGMSTAYSGRGEVPYNDAAWHLAVLEMGHFQLTLAAPVGQHQRYTKLVVDRDVGIVRGSSGDGFSAATMRAIIGQAVPGGDQPGSYRWKNVGRAVGKISPAQYDLLWSWARGKGVAARTKTLVVGCGNSYVAGVNVGTEAMFKRLLSDLGARADFINCGYSGATSAYLLDALPLVDKTFLSNAQRPRVVAFFFEWLNDLGGLTGAQAYANVKQWCLNARALMPLGAKIVMTTPINWNPGDATFVARKTEARNLVLAEPLGTYFDAVVDWGNPDWRYGDGSWTSDMTRNDGSLHPTQLMYDELIATGAHPLVPVLSALIPT